MMSHLHRGVVLYYIALGFSIAVLLHAGVFLACCGYSLDKGGSVGVHVTSGSPL